MEEKILITGATGTVGSVVAQWLISKGVPIRVFARNEEKAKAIVKDYAPVFTGDFADVPSLDAALEGIERLFLVAPPSTGLVDHEKQVIDRAKASGVSYIVLISVIAAGPDSPTQIGRMHGEVEDHLKASGLKYTILRPHSFMQTLLGSIPSIVGEGKIYSALGEGTMPMIDARDIGEVAAQILLDDRFEAETLDLTGPKAYSYKDVAESLSQQLEKEIQYVPVPGEAAEHAMVGMGFPQWLAHDLVTFMQEWAEGKNAGVSESVQRVIGHTPRSIGEFISDHLNLFKPSETAEHG